MFLTVLSSRDLDKLGGNLDIVFAVLNFLRGEISAVVLVVSVAIESVALVTGMAYTYCKSISTLFHLSLMPLTLKTLDNGGVKPHETCHEGFR